MKKSYQHIIKKSYTTPKIEEVEIDVAISLEQISTGEDEFEPLSGESNGVSSTSLPDYGTITYTSSDELTPFGSSTPDY